MALFDLLCILAGIAIGLLLTVWAGTLVIRMAAEWMERRALRRLRVAWERERAEREAAGKAVTARPITGQEPPRRKGRDAVIIVLSPVIAITGLVLTWHITWMLTIHDVMNTMWIPTLYAVLVQGAVAVSLVCAWWWLSKTTRARSCPRCGYDMQVIEGNQCPECGTESNEVRLTRRRKRRVLLLLPLLLIPSSYATLKWVHVRKAGWFELVPTTLLIPVMEHLPEEYMYDNRKGNESAALCNRGGRMWDWQGDWLHRRGIGVSESTTDPEVAKRFREIFTPNLEQWHPTDEVVIKSIEMLMSGDPHGAELANVILFYLTLQQEAVPERITAIVKRYAGQITAKLPEIADRDVHQFSTCTELYKFMPEHAKEAIDVVEGLLRREDISKNQASTFIGVLLDLRNADGQAHDRMLGLAKNGPAIVRPLAIWNLLTFEHNHEWWANILTELEVLTLDPDDAVALSAIRLLILRQPVPTSGSEWWVVEFDRRGRPHEWVILWEEYAETDISARFTSDFVEQTLRFAEDPATPIDARVRLCSVIFDSLDESQQVIPELEMRLLAAMDAICTSGDQPQRDWYLMNIDEYRTWLVRRWSEWLWPASSEDAINGDHAE
jgi:hypothetical protein